MSIIKEFRNVASSRPASQSANIVGFAPSSTVIVVPCYNEAKRLDRDAFVKFLDETPDVSIVFVNDGSKDNTLDVLTALHDARPHRIEVLSLSRNSGKAEAVRLGLLHATGTGAKFVGYWDADLATPLDAIADFTRIGAKFREVDVIFGSRRMMLGHRIERTFTRRMVSRACATLARMAVRLPIGDTQCGAKLLRNTDQLQVALSNPFTAGWLFDVELFTRISAATANRNDAFYELPLCEWNEIAGSKVSGRAIVRSGFQMLRLIAENRLGVKAAPALATDTVANIVRGQNNGYQLVA